ncbi:MAG: acetyltransferase [Burkholderiaceae bacterium]|nr:acetyltransferase [Burkholderiaceae bacterium]
MPSDPTPSTGPSRLRLIGLYGAGGFAREVMPLLRQQCARPVDGDRAVQTRLVFIETEPAQRSVNGLPVLSEDEFFATACDERLFNVAIGNSAARERIAQTCLARGAQPLSIRGAMARVYDGNQIGEGAILCDQSIVTSNARIGRFFHANLFSYVAHDCVIGDFVTFAPNVHCNGNVHIHHHAYIGTGAVLKQGTPERPLIVGEGAVVGMGAVVTRDVAPHTTVVGNPARALQRS